MVAGLSRAAGEAGGWTHWGATTQDIVDTATVLQMREGLALIRASLCDIVAALAAQADKHRRTVMAGRTYLQQALPTTLRAEMRGVGTAADRASASAGCVAAMRRAGELWRGGGDVGLAR